MDPTAPCVGTASLTSPLNHAQVIVLNYLGLHYVVDNVLRTPQTQFGREGMRLGGKREERDEGGREGGRGCEVLLQYFDEFNVEVYISADSATDEGCCMLL